MVFEEQEGAEPSVGQWRPKWRREGQDPLLLRIQEPEPTSVLAEDNPCADNEVVVHLWNASSLAALPANATPWRKGGNTGDPLAGRRCQVCRD